MYPGSAPQRCGSSRGVLLFLVMVLFGAAGGASEGLDAVSRGDLAHYQGDAVTARQAYRQAVDSGEPAAEAMARLRLLAYSGNFGAWVHGPAIDRALRAAEGSELDLAWMDFHIFAPAFVGASREEAIRIALELQDRFPSESMSRLFLLTQEEQWLRRLRELPDRDGMGEAFIQTNGMLPNPPASWNLGIGFSGAPGLGIGAGIRFTHGDLRGWSSELWLGGSTLKSGYAVIRAQSLARLHAQFDVGLLRGVLYNYGSGERESIWREAAWAEVGPGFRQESWRFWLVGRFRLDDAGTGLQPGHGLELGATFDTRQGWGSHRRGIFAALQGDLVLGGGEAHQGLFADLRSYVGVLRGVLAARATHQQAFNPDVSFFRLPSVGGMTLHRGAPFQRWRAARITTVDLEQRWMVWGPIEAVLMTNAAWVVDSGLHPAGGVGLRLLLPPEESNVSRLDLAFSDTGWGLYAAYGEAF